MRKKLWNVIAILAIVAALLATATPAAAQSGTVTDYGDLPQKGQLVIPAGKGWVAPEQWNGLNVTVWYGTADDNNSTMSNLGAGLANDRVKKYGGSAADYPTVVWGGPSVHVGGDCRGQFYSDATVLTAGVVYGDECPVLIEYNAEGHFIAQPATQPGPEATPETTPVAVPPTDGGGFQWNWGWCLWPLVLAGLILGGIWLWRRRRPAAPRPPAPPAPVVAPAPMPAPKAPEPKAPAPPAPKPQRMRDHRPAAPQLPAGRAQSRQGKPRSQTGAKRRK